MVAVAVALICRGEECPVSLMPCMLMQERQNWLRLAKNPKSAAAVFFNLPVEVRACARLFAGFHNWTDICVVFRAGMSAACCWAQG